MSIVAEENPVPANGEQTALEQPNYFRLDTLDRMSDPADLYKFINKTLKLSDRDFDTVLHDLGYRVASWHQRAGALRGDVKLVTACEVYLKRAEMSLLRTRARPEPEKANAPFIQVNRSAKS